VLKKRIDKKKDRVEMLEIVESIGMSSRPR
jgi:hypothetical protein